LQWSFNEDAPIYLQIVEQIKTQIAIGLLKPGDKMPAVRDLAIEAGVNPNTMQKALSQLEREGLLYTQRTAGRFVSDSKEKTHELQETLQLQYMKNFTDNMMNLGYRPEEAAQLYMEYVKNM
jgi:DNA-binding transcriptional regulator YhcF (GntR family)